MGEGTMAIDLDEGDGVLDVLDLEVEVQADKGLPRKVRRLYLEYLVQRRLMLQAREEAAWVVEDDAKATMDEIYDELPAEWQW